MKAFFLSLTFMLVSFGNVSEKGMPEVEESLTCETWATFQPCGEESKFYLCQDGRSLDDLMEAANYFIKVKCD